MSKYFVHITETEYRAHLLNLIKVEEKELNRFNDMWFTKCLVFKDSTIYDYLLSDYEINKLESFLVNFTKTNLEYKLSFTKVKTTGIGNSFHEDTINKHEKFKDKEYKEISSYTYKKIEKGTKSIEQKLNLNPPSVTYEIKLQSTNEEKGMFLGLLNLDKQQTWQIIFFKDSEDWFWVRARKIEFALQVLEEEFIRCDDFTGFMKYLENRFSEF